MEDFHQGTAGPTVTVPDSVREVFQLIFTEPIMDHIVEESNRYACLVMGESKYEKWERLKRDDIFAYLGIMVIWALWTDPVFTTTGSEIHCTTVHLLRRE